MLGILAIMSLRSRYQDLPIKAKHLLLISILALLAFWAQQGFVMDADHFLFLLANYSIWFVLLPWVYSLVKESNWPTIIQWPRKIAVLVIIILTQWILSNFLLSTLKFALFNQYFGQDWQELASFLLPSLATRVIDLVLFLGVLSWLHQQRAISDHKVNEAQSQALINQSKLESLKGQLNPHFLFNALHSINSQIGYNDENARQLNMKFSHLLRRLLTINQQDEYTLKEELDFVEMYLDIEKERFKDRLTIHMEVDNQALQCTVPTMVLQPLIENAFKHGISKITTPSVLEIVIILHENELIIKVKNEIDGTGSESRGAGTGLRNLEDRLTLYYDQPIKFATKLEGKYFLSSLTLPA